MSVEDTTVSFSLEVNVEEAYAQVRRLQTLLFRTLSLVRRVSGNEDLNQAIMVMQRAIAIANQLRLAYAALQAARLAAGDPLAWAIAGVGVATAVVSLDDLTGSYG